MSTQENFSKRLSNLREALGLSQTEFAKQLGVSRNYVSMIEGGREPSESLVKLFESIERDHQSGVPTRRDEPGKNQLTSRAVDVFWIPVISWAHAGQASAYEELPAHWQDKIPVICRSEKAFGLVIEGDSMEPRCVSSDIVVVMPDEEPRNGCLVVAKLRDDGILLRRYAKLTDGNIRLSAYNPVYPAIDYSPSAFHWIYPVHSTTRREWN